MKRRLFFLTLISTMVSVLQLNATTIGSDTAVTLISTMTTLNNGDIVTGFTSLQGGFILTDTSVTATWNALFPVSGVINLNGGSLYLQRSLYTTDILTLSLPGAIIGNGYLFDLAPTTTIAGFAPGCVPYLAITQPVAPLQYNSGLGGAANVVSWSYDDRFVTIGGVSSGGGPSLANYRFNSTGLTLAGTLSSGINILSVAWHPSAYYIALVSTSATAVYSVNSLTGALTLASSVGTTSYTAAWHPTGFYLMTSGGGNLLLYPVSAAGVLGTPTTVATFVGQLFACDWAKTGSYVALGLQGAANRVYIYELGGTPTVPTLTAQTSFDVGLSLSTVIRNLAWNPVYPNILAVGQTNNPSGDTVQLWQFTPPSTMTLLTSIAGLTTRVSALDWSNDGGCLMVGISASAVSANKLQVYSFNGTTLTLVASSAFPNNSPNSGVPGNYSPVNNYIAQWAMPTVSTSQLRISLPYQTRNFFGSNLNMSMHGDLDLKLHYLTMSGDCSILGNGNTLSLDATAALAIAANSTLTLKNLTLQGISTSPIQMADSSSTLILDNVTITLDGSTTFTQGTLEVEGNVELVGQGAFIYSSTMPCVVDAQTTLLFDNDITFSFVPASSARNLLQFTDSSSRLFLNGATLATTQTGIDFTKGTLVVNRHATIASDATVAAEGIAFGDGVDVANNMNLQVYPAAVLEVAKGIVVNNNI